MADWFKFFNDGLDEPRFQFAISEQPLVTSVWLVILSEASKRRCSKITWRDQDYELLGFARKVNVSPPVFNQCVGLLERIGYIARSEGVIEIPGWERLQSDYAKGLARGYYKNNSPGTSDGLASLSGNAEVSTSRREETRGDEINSEYGKSALNSLSATEEAKRKATLMERCRTVFGEEEMRLRHQRWYDRSSKHPGKLDRVLADMERFMKDGGFFTKSAAARAEEQWKRFHD